MNINHQLHQTEEANSHTHNAPFWVRHYDRIVGFMTLGRTEKMHRATVDLAKLQAGDAVLDIGCGSGKLILQAGKVVGQSGTAVGLDVEAAMIAHAKKNAAKTHTHATFGLASIDNIPYPDNSFDAVFNSLVYHHLTSQQKEDGFREVLRVLKPNGRFIVVDINPTRRSITTSLPGHNRMAHEDYVHNKVTEQLETAGFSNVQMGTHSLKQLSYAIGVKK